MTKLVIFLFYFLKQQGLTSPSRACDEHGFALRDGRQNMLLLVSPFYWSGVKVSPMLAFRSIFSPGPEMPPFPGFPNKAHRSPVHLIHFIPIPGRPRPLSECNRQKQVYLTYLFNIIRSAVKSRGKCLILSIKRQRQRLDFFRLRQDGAAVE